MLVKAFSYPSIPSLVVVFLNTSFHFFLSIGIYQAIADLVENFGHIFIASKTVVENVLRSQLLHIVCMINELVKEAYIRSDRIVIWGIWTHFIGYNVQELGLREVINDYWGKIQAAIEEVGIERNVSQETRSTRLEMDPGNFKLLGVSKSLVFCLSSMGNRTSHLLLDTTTTFLFSQVAGLGEYFAKGRGDERALRPLPALFLMSTILAIGC